jgi:23S rRNA pseudouridine2605 synthase
MPEERVQKILARAGYGSRRASEELISAGRVKINGKLAVLGSKADPRRDTVTIDNQQIAKEQAPVYIAVNKPQGILSEVSPEEPRETVRDLVPVPGHMFIVGRLDMESEGLILLTNDGELANKLSHPRYGHEKEYRVLVGTRPDIRQLEAWRHGVVLEDGYRTAPAQVRVDSTAGKGVWLQVILHEGRKRQIREMGKLTGMPVLRIVRVRIGSLLLGDLKPGVWRELRQDEVRALKVNKAYREAGREEKTRQPRRPMRSGRPGEASAEGRRAPSRTFRGIPSDSPAQRPARPPRGGRTDSAPSGRARTGAPDREPREGDREEGRREAPRSPSRGPARPSTRPTRSGSSSHAPSGRATTGHAPSGAPSREPRGESSRSGHGAPRRTPRKGSS